MKKRIGVLINPTARSGRAKKSGAKLLKYFKHRGLEVVDLSGANWNDATKNAKTGLFANRLDAFVIAGGDGTVHLGTNIIAETQLPFGIIPIGSGNDAARGLGLPENKLKESADIIIDNLNNEPTPVDLGYAGDIKNTKKRQWFMANVAGGFASKVCTRIESIKYPRGDIRYILAIFIEMMKLKPEKYRVTIDGITKTFESLLFGVGNGPDVGGGLRLFPNASFDNHLFEFSTVVPMGKKRFINLVSKAKKEDLTNIPELYTDYGHEIIVEAKGHTETIYADGEDIGPLPMKYTIIPNGLYIVGAKPIHRTALSKKIANKEAEKYSIDDTKNILNKVLNSDVSLELQSKVKSGKKSLYKKQSELKSKLKSKKRK
jgi:diacylglycerol kinase (ATP)